MAYLDHSSLKTLTQLSRIECTKEEAEALLFDMQKIVGYVEKLQELDTEDCEPCSYVLADQVNVMREDEVGETLDREEFLANSPAHVGGHIRVPTVIKQVP